MFIITGGPGSGKGRIIANLKSTFGAKLISAESLILDNLPKKVQQVMSITTTREISKLVRKDPSHVPLEWVLSLLQKAISSDPSQFYVVDMIPCLNWLLRNNYFIKECTKEMKAFEIKVYII